MKRKKDKLEKISWGGMIALILFLVILFFLKGESLNYKEHKQINISSFEELAEYCSLGNIFDRAECTNRVVKAFYIYNLSNMEKLLSFDEIKREGGVCSQWSEFYCLIGEEYGYYTTMPQFLTKEAQDYLLYHQVCIWSNSDGYILFDGESTFEVHTTNSIRDISAYVEGNL